MNPLEEVKEKPQYNFVVEKRTAHVKSNGQKTWSKWYSIRKFTHELNAITRSYTLQRIDNENPVPQFITEYRVKSLTHNNHE